MTEALKLARITLAVDACGYSTANIELAVKLAKFLNAHLHGLFIEDIDLLQSAEFPFTTEITLSTGQERKFDSNSVQRTLRIKSSEFRNSLAVSAESSRVVWSFDSVRGRKNLRDPVWRENSEMTILGLGLTGRRPRVRQDRERILLFLDHETNLSGILSLLISLSTKPAIELTLAGSDPSRLDVLRKTLNESQQADGRVSLRQRDEHEIIQGVKNARDYFDFVVASSNAESEALQWMLDNPSCPVILVS